MKVLIFLVSSWLFEWRGLSVSFEDMNISLARGDAPLDVSGQLLVAADSDNAFCGGHFHAQVELMDHRFELVDEASAKDCEVRLVHFNYIEGYMLCFRVGCVPEGYRQ